MEIEPYLALPDGARFDHVCIAGPSLRRLWSTYVDALRGEFVWGEILDVGAVVATVHYPGGGGNVELMAPTAESTFLDSFFARTGGLGGVHHLTFVVHDLPAAVATVRASGATIFGERYDDPVWSEAFVHPRSNDGVLVQLAQPGPQIRDPFITSRAVLFAATGEQDGP